MSSIDQEWAARAVDNERAVIAGIRRIRRVHHGIKRVLTHTVPVNSMWLLLTLGVLVHKVVVDWNGFTWRHVIGVALGATIVIATHRAKANQ